MTAPVNMKELSERIAALQSELDALTKHAEIAQAEEHARMRPPSVTYDRLHVTASRPYEHAQFIASYNGEPARKKRWLIRLRAAATRALNGEYRPQVDFYFSSAYDMKRALMFGLHMYRLGALTARDGDMFATDWPDDVLPKENIDA